MTQRTVVLLVTAAVLFAAAVAGHGQTDDALRWKLKQLQAELNRLQAQQRLAQAEAARSQDAQQALAGLQNELANTQLVLAEELERHRSTRGILAGARQALEQASAAVVKLRWAQTRQNEATAAAQAEMQAELMEAQQRQWQAEQELADVRRSRDANLQNERLQKAAARQTLASVQEQLRDAQASLVRGQEREAALRQDLSQARQRLAQVEANSVDAQVAQQALASLSDELAGARSALTEEQGSHRATRRTLAGVRQALEQASAAVVKQRWAQTRQDEAHAAAQTAIQTDLLEAQQRQWQAEQDTISLRQELSRANAMASGLQAQVANAQGDVSDAQEALAAARQKLADFRTALAEERSRYNAAAQVLSSTQQALAEKQLELDGVSRVAAVRQGMLASVQQQLRDAQTLMVQNQERQADLEQALAQAQQDLAQANAAAEQAQGEIVRQARGNEARQAQMNRDLMEARLQGDAVRLILASVREELARTRRSLEREQGRNAAQGEVLASTQAVLSETSGSLAEVRAALAEQSEAHAGAQAAVQADRQQWVERYWDMEQQRNETRQALRRAEQSHAAAQQVLDRRDARRAEIVARTEAVADLVRQHFADEIQQGQLSVRAGKWRVKLTSADAFDFVRAVELGKRSVQTLDRLAEMLRENPSHQVRFAVHTDNVPLRRGARWPTNWELSTARAAKLARYLIDQGVAPERLSIGGYGDSRPVADNSTSEGRQQNRRVEVLIKAPRQK